MSGATSESSEARERILAAAEQLIIKGAGQHEVSVRQIADAARANLALISYYFGNKDGLLATLYEHRAKSMVGERKVRLGMLPPDADVKSILDAWLAPMLDIEESGDLLARRALSTYLQTFDKPLYAKLFASSYDTENIIFVKALSRALPYLSRSTILWRLYALAGAALITTNFSAQESMDQLSAGQCQATDRKMQLRQLLAFAATGFAAPEIGRELRMRHGLSITALHDRIPLRKRIRDKETRATVIGDVV